MDRVSVGVGEQNAAGAAAGEGGGGGAGGGNFLPGDPRPLVVATCDSELKGVRCRDSSESCIGRTTAPQRSTGNLEGSLVQARYVSAWWLVASS